MRISESARAMALFGVLPSAVALADPPSPAPDAKAKPLTQAALHPASPRREALPTPAPGTCVSKWRYEFGRGPEDRLTTHTFDSGGNLTNSVTATNLCTLAGFNTGCRDSSSETRSTYQQGRLESRTSSSTDDGRTTAGAAFSYEYDAAGRVTKLTITNSGWRGIAYTFRYDAKGELSGRTLDNNGDGKADFIESIKVKRNVAGQLSELKYERTKPKIDLKRRDQMGMVSKTTTYAYDAAGHLVSATAVSKAITLDFSKPSKNSIYPLMLEEKTQTTGYHTTAEGLIDAIRTCRDPADDTNCNTMTLTMASGTTPEKTFAKTGMIETTEEELYGNCYFEQISPMESYLSPSSGPNGMINAAPDNFSFRMVFGKRGAKLAAAAGGSQSP